MRDWPHRGRGVSPLVLDGLQSFECGHRENATTSLSAINQPDAESVGPFAVVYSSADLTDVFCLLGNSLNGKRAEFRVLVADFSAFFIIR
jgi:hypothetical protein